MEARISGILFTSKFDSGNLAKVERIHNDDEDDPSSHRIGDIASLPDYEFNLWTRPDCDGTEFQNANRSWFHFAVKGCPQNKLMKLNVMNMNRQGKLYNQGMAPVVKVLPQKPRWERIRDRPVCETIDGQFIMSFTYRFEYRYSTVYFAFCYPFSYTECQNKLEELDQQFTASQELGPSSPAESIYYHRELLCNSLDGLRVDLITISSCHGITKQREPRLDKLFPDMNTPRAHRFENKRVYFLSSRVHPGETPASFVFNGFLDFILRPKDPRAKQLRKQFVFKMIPLLNPDGVQRGHYRTDQRGVNLNRMYTNPDFGFHPSVYAAKSLVVYHHMHSRVKTILSSEDSNTRTACGDGSGTSGKSVKSGVGIDGDMGDSGLNSIATLKQEKNRKENITEGNSENVDSNENIPTPSNHQERRADSRGTETSSHHLSDNCSLDNSDDEDICSAMDDFSLETKKSFNNNNSNNTDSLLVPPNESGIAFYVDLHGHASKRGCFMYGNHLPDEEKQVENVLFPKLISLNSSHFDFDGCNFSEKNMYSKDKRDGMSKEGSGRVAILKATGIIHSYTLECNYNTGRFMNSIAPACMDDGRATPPQVAGFPPKYSISHFEGVGRALAVAALDLTDTNPWSRLASTEYSSVHAIRAWVQRYLRSMKGAPSLPKKMSRVASKTSSLVATATSRQNLQIKTKPRLVAGDTKAVAFGRGLTQRPPVSPTRKPVPSKHLGPVKETRASIERKKKITSNQPMHSSKSLPTRDVSLKSFEKPPNSTNAIKSHIPTSLHLQNGKDPVSLSLTHKPSNVSLSIIRSRANSRNAVGKLNPSTGHQALSDNKNNKKINEQEKGQSIPQDSAVVQSLLNHMVVKVLEQRADSAMADYRHPSSDEFNPRAVNVPQRPHSAFPLHNTDQHFSQLTQRPVSRIIMQIPQMSSQVVKPAAVNNQSGKPMFKSFIQRKNNNGKGKKNPSQDRRDLTTLTNIMQKSPKKSSIAKKNQSQGPSRKQNQPKHKQRTSIGQHQEDDSIHTGYVDNIIQQRLLNSSLSDPSPGESINPNFNCKSLEPKSSASSPRRYSAPQATTNIGPQFVMSRSRSTSPLRTLSCQVMDLNKFTTKQPHEAPQPFWDGL